MPLRLESPDGLGPERKAETLSALENRGANLGWSVGGRTRWRAAAELLEARQYERVADLLREAQVASEETGDDVLADILAAARRICLACNECRTDVAWHQRACEEADQRERELRKQLGAILDHFTGREPPEPSDKGERPPRTHTVELGLTARRPPVPVERRGLWQRIQALLRRVPRPRPPDRAAPVPPAVLKAQVSAVLSIVKEDLPSPPSLVVYCLGPFRVFQNDQLIADWTGLKGQCILKYLVAHRGRPIAKEILMDVFWRDAEPEAARRNLHQAVYCLRQTLRRGEPDFQHVQFENDCYSLNPQMDIWLDFEEFEKHVRRGRRLDVAGQLAAAMAEFSVAESLYEGDFLEEDLYEDWPRSQREHIRATYLDIVDCLSDHYVRQSAHTAAIALCRKVLAQDHCYEEAHRRLMKCYLVQGQRHLAVRQYQSCVEALKEELDLEPSDETVELYRHITGVA